MKNSIVFIGLFFVIFSINKINAQDITTYEPNKKSEVHIQKDENGNIISYDSTYVETWSSDGSDIDIDEFMNSFGQDFANFDNQFFNSPNDINDTTSSFSDNFFAFPDINKMQEQMIREMQEMQKMFENDDQNSNIKEEKNDNNLIDNDIKHKSVKI